jgi:hypothetical protein
VYTHGFLGTVRVLYAQPDCQGDPFISDVGFNFMSQEYGVDDQQRLHVGEPDTDTVFDLMSHTEGAGCQNSNVPVQFIAARAMLLFNLAGRWTPPFRLHP